jgi:hypothetical protein
VQDEETMDRELDIHDAAVSARESDGAGAGAGAGVRGGRFSRRVVKLMACVGAMLCLSAGMWVYQAYRRSEAASDALATLEASSYVAVRWQGPEWLREFSGLTFLQPFDRVTFLEVNDVGPPYDAVRVLMENQIDVESVLIETGGTPAISLDAICSGLSPRLLTIYYEDNTVPYDEGEPPSEDIFRIDQNNSVSSLIVRGNLVDNRVWKMVAGMSGLESLDISVCPNVTTIPADIESLKRLRRFQAFGTPLDDPSFVLLAGECRALEHVDCGSTGIGDRGFRALCGIESLRSLSASWTQVSQEAVNAVGEARRLEYLAISNTEAKTLPPISGCSALRTLNAVGILMDRDAVDILVKLENLERLSLSLNEFNLELLERLIRERPSLRHICVSGVFLSDVEAARYQGIRPDVTIEIGLASCEFEADFGDPGDGDASGPSFTPSAP